jgi:hypothetical protein
MHLVEIARRTVTLELTPEECRAIAACCRHAAEQIVPDHQRATLLAALFDAAALAGLSYSYVDPRTAECLTLSAMRAAAGADLVDHATVVA